MLRDVACNFAAPSGMSNVDGVAKIQVLGDGSDIGGIGVHLMAACRLR